MLYVENIVLFVETRKDMASKLERKREALKSKILRICRSKKKIHTM